MELEQNVETIFTPEQIQEAKQLAKQKEKEQSYIDSVTSHKFPEKLEPTATAWATMFFLTLSELGWFKHPFYGHRIPHVTEFTERHTYHFGVPVPFV